LGTEQVVVDVAIEVLQRRVDEPVEEGWDWHLGVEGFEKKPNLELILGLWLVDEFSQCCCFFSIGIFGSVFLSLGIDVQNAFLQPATIFTSLHSCVMWLISNGFCFEVYEEFEILDIEGVKRGWYNCFRE
jgi:hypothetical protein